MLREGEYDKSSRGWVPLADLPKADSAAELYGFSEELKAKGIAHTLHLGSKKVEVKGLPTSVLSWEVFVPPVYMEGWEAAKAEFLKNARTRFDLPLGGARSKLLVAIFASQIANTK